jgi:hypothetical protein
MYSFVHSKTRNRLGVEKAEALYYIYTNSCLLRQRPSLDPVRYYDDNIFSKDSDDEDKGLSEIGDDDHDNIDDNNGNGSKGRNGSDGDSSGEHRKSDLPIILGNLHPEAVYD